MSQLGLIKYTRITVSLIYPPLDTLGLEDSPSVLPPLSPSEQASEPGPAQRDPWIFNQVT